MITLAVYDRKLQGRKKVLIIAILFTTTGFFCNVYDTVKTMCVGVV